MATAFNALVVSEGNDGTYKRGIQQRPLDSLPNHDVHVRVYYSALNYKDALSASGNKGVTQEFPHTPGVDAAGVVAKSDDARFTEGDEVIVTSFDLGQNTSGGFGEYISIPGDWIVPLPEGLSLRESMMLGTAGFTAAYGVQRLIEAGADAQQGLTLVTGATGGVGSMAVAFLAQAGFSVTAATGKTDQADFLESLGAQKIINRKQLQDNSGRPLLKSEWTTVFDTVGGAMLDVALRQTAYDGHAACCGNILGGQLKTSIYPFILRGLTLLGVDSGRTPMPKRRAVWQTLASEWTLPDLEAMTRKVSLEGINAEIDKILDGRQVGKILLRHDH